MTKKEITRSLQQIAALLEVKGENHFKVRAHENAARILSSFQGTLAEFLSQAASGKIKGIGAGLTQTITELLKDLSPTPLETLQSEIPPGVLEILNIPGLGAKKVRLLYEDLSITSIEELQAAIAENKLSALKGFGEKSQQNILGGIELLNSYRGFSLFPEALSQGEAIIEQLKQTGLCENVELAGSLRRRKETIKDIDILAVSSNAAALMQAFSELPGISRILSKGAGITRAALESGASAELRVVTLEQYPSALLHFTGSEEHNTALRSEAKTLNYTLDESGLFDGTKRVFAASEDDLYRELHLNFIPPELREDMGEIEHAKEAYELSIPLPPLIEQKDLTGILHAHTKYSDGRNSLREMACAVSEQGYTYFGVSDHSQSAKYANGLLPDAVKRQHEEIDRLNEELFPFHIYKGIESDILPDGSLDYDDSLLSTFDFIIASVHSNFTMNRKDMTARIVRALENPFTTILGHPTGRLLLKREAYELDLEEVLETAAKHGAAVEINAHPKRLDLDWRFLRKAKALGIYIPICPDSHAVDQLGLVDVGIGIARKGGLTKSDVLNTFERERLEEFFLSRKQFER